jgi:hypothetical protein
MNRGVVVLSSVFLLVLGSLFVSVYALDCLGNPRCIIRQAAVERNPDICSQMNETALVDGCKGYVEEIKTSSPQTPFGTFWLWTIAAVVAIILVVAIVITMKRRNRF